MTPARIALVLFILVLAALVAVGAWGEGGSTSLSDDDYIAIALSQPQVFHPSGASSGSRVVAERVERGRGSVAVDVISDGERFRVVIDTRTNQVTRVERR
jgi:hypothetical protein